LNALCWGVNISWDVLWCGVAHELKIVNKDRLCSQCVTWLRTCARVVWSRANWGANDFSRS